jgi:hypothetical protein
VLFLDEKQHHETLNWIRLKGDEVKTSDEYIVDLMSGDKKGSDEGM